MSNRVTSYSLRCSADTVTDAVQQHYSVQREALRKHRITYYDTFDWRLYKKSFALVSEPAGSDLILTLTSFDSDDTLRQRTSAVPAFGRDLPSGVFSETVAPILEMRRLIPVAEIEIWGSTSLILNKEDKTVVRLQLRNGTAFKPGETLGGVPLTPLLKVIPLKGYRNWHDKVIGQLGEISDLQELEGNEIDHALEAIGRTPCDYTSKLNIRLDPWMQADVAAKTIHQALFSVIRANEQGTIENLDSEFLHDFRVGVRRTRAALGQIKGVFPPKVLRHFLSEFSWLGKVTGPTRDLDVYLLKIEGYKDSLPETVRSDLNPLTEFLRSHHQQEHSLLVRSLTSDRYLRLMQDWDEFLSEIETQAAAPVAAGMPIQELASQRIWKVYRRIIKKGCAIGDDTPAEAFHQLRIETKKLRYLMEFFKRLYDESQINRMVKVLRRLQDNLGDFNDFEVQQASLNRFAEQMVAEGTAQAQTLMAMGRLVDRLEQGQARERERFARRFVKFSSTKNRNTFQQLFAANPGKEVTW
jgi:CHAD domain-containing protein